MHPAQREAIRQEIKDLLAEVGRPALPTSIQARRTHPRAALFLAALLGLDRKSVV